MTAPLDDTLAALADPTRRALVDLLAEGARRPSELAELLAIPRPATSRHLRVLRRAGLVRETLQEDDARVRLYALELEPLEGLRDWLDEVAAFWEDQLQSFKAHAERGGKPR